LWENLSASDHLEDLDLQEMIILKWTYIEEVGLEGVDWTDMASG
jgi:hypothetical protein